MSANNTLFQQETEALIQENPDMMPPPQEPTPKEIFIEKLKRKAVRLSYSSLKNLDSPVNFMRYFLEQKVEKSKSQSIGSLVDVKVLTPEKFEETFVVLDVVPTTDLQVNFCNEVLRMLDADKEVDIDTVYPAAFAIWYKKGTCAELDKLKPYIEALLDKKEIVSTELNDKATKIANHLLAQDDIMSELGCIEETQKVIEFELKRWKFKSALDTWSPKLFHDLKFATDCSPDKFEYDIRKFSYDVQFGLYALGLEILGLSQNPEFKFIVFDALGNYSILTVDQSYVMFAKRKVEFLIDCLDKMVAEEAFDKSYNYFKSRSTIYRPNYLKGLDYDVLGDINDQEE